MANIAPPDLRRQASADTLIRRIEARSRGTYEIPLMSDINDHPIYRLSSRSPIWTRSQAEEYDIVEEWTNQWQHSAVNNASLIDDPSLPLPGLKNPVLSRGEC